MTMKLFPLSLFRFFLLNREIFPIFFPWSNRNCFLLAFSNQLWKILHSPIPYSSIDPNKEKALVSFFFFWLCSAISSFILTRKKNFSLSLIQLWSTLIFFYSVRMRKFLWLLILVCITKCYSCMFWNTVLDL